MRKTVTMKMDWAKVVNDTPALKRGRVWCHACGWSEEVDSAHCLAHGWPVHCGATMGIDSPAERETRKK